MARTAIQIGERLVQVKVDLCAFIIRPQDMAALVALGATVTSHRRDFIRLVLAAAGGAAVSAKKTRVSSTACTTPQSRMPLPSQVLDLRAWYLTLPINNAQAITQPQLATFVDPDHFCVSADGKAVIVTAECGGSTTSNSSYPRSELREMKLDGTTRASWSSSTGIHTMQITQAVTHLPVAKAQVVCGQILNSSDDVIQLVMDGTKNATSPALRVRWKGSSQSAPVIAAVPVGQKFNVTVTAKGGHMMVAAGGIVTHTFSYSGSGLYFKAGCYTQSNTSKGDLPTAYGQVEISALSVTHTT